jgi:hypothetical protein
MDTGIALCVGLFGGGSVLGFAQFMISRHDKRKDEHSVQLDRIEKKVDAIGEQSDRTELAQTRLQLFFLMIMQPENKDAILKTAQRYFMELDGNGEAWDAFAHWASENGVNIDYYKKKGANHGE